MNKRLQAAVRDACAWSVSRFFHFMKMIGGSGTGCEIWNNRKEYV